ncbi:MAG: hypothetical protein P1S46_05830 [bacterium]|nr:hypothetical protein [bacterium]
MFINRLIGGTLAAASFIMLGLAMSSLGSGGVGVQVMDRMGLPYILAFLAAQFVLLVIFVTPAERPVPVLLLVGGTVVYMVILGVKGGGSSVQHSLYAGSAFSGLATGLFAMLGGKG